MGIKGIKVTAFVSRARNHLGGEEPLLFFDFMASQNYIWINKYILSICRGIQE